MLRFRNIQRGLGAIVAVGLIASCSARIAPAGVEIAVRRPPSLRVEVRSNPPGPNYVWVSGHHAWRGGDYVWVPGEWMLPPNQQYRRWEPGHWIAVRGGWYWVDGRWR